MGEKTVTVWTPEGTGAAVAPLPIIYLNVFQGDGGDVWDACHELGCPPFVLAAIGDLDWDRNLSPWECDGTVRGAEPFAGEADAHLDEILGRIVPKVESSLPQPPAWRGIAGYSLAGLFALWSLVYLSLGKKETKTPNRMMRHVLDDTRAMEELLRGRGVDTAFELNPGNHFAETDARMARGIKWLLERQPPSFER